MRDFVKQLVSIHAPARGATRRRCLPRHLLLRFNSRTRAGCDTITYCSWHNGTHVSIHAPARGATNSDLDYSLFNYVSIHAPARGATVYINSRARKC